MRSARQTCEKAGPGSAKTRSSKVPERAQSGSVVWCLTVTVSRVKCQAGKRTIGVTPGSAGFAVAVAGIKSKSPATIRATRTGSARIDPPKPFIQASPTIPAAREALTLGRIGIVLKILTMRVGQDRPRRWAPTAPRRRWPVAPAPPGAGPHGRTGASCDASVAAERHAGRRPALRQPSRSVSATGDGRRRRGEGQHAVARFGLERGGVLGGQALPDGREGQVRRP